MNLLFYIDNVYMIFGHGDQSLYTCSAFDCPRVQSRNFSAFITVAISNSKSDNSNLLPTTKHRRQITFSFYLLTIGTTAD